MKAVSVKRQDIPLQKKIVDEYWRRGYTLRSSDDLPNGTRCLRFEKKRRQR